MNTRLLTMLALTLTLAACAEDGKDGADGTDGADGAAGEDGTAGEDGAVGEDGAAGTDAPCADSELVEITGLTGLPTDTVAAFYPTDAITVESNAPGDLTYTVAGYGLDYEWDGDSFTVTPTTGEPSSQVIVATDGCSTATYQFSLDAKVGTSLVNIVHLYDGAPSVDVTLSGDDAEDALLTGFGIGTETGYFEWSSAPYTFDLWSEGAVAATLPTIELQDEMAYTLVVYSDGGAATSMLIEDDLSEVATEDAARVSVTHVADGVGQVDIWETVLGAALFSDLDYGTTSAPTDTLTGEYTVGIDTTDDGTTEYDFQPVDLEGLEGAPVNVFAYLQSGTPFLFVSAPWYGYSARVLPDPLPAPSSTVTGSSAPAGYITAYTYTTDTITITDACSVLDITVDVDISHTWRNDIRVSLTAPDGTSAYLHYNSGGSADDLIGSYALDGTGTLTSADDLSAFLLTAGTGDWTLEIYDTFSDDDGTLNSWDLTLGCL